MLHLPKASTWKNKNKQIIKKANKQQNSKQISGFHEAT